ncbi:MAG: hypothetical protein K2N37_02525, partial [Lachnospiraceae bacterium]|nr:hypothetical protein [Lachnospiraceae bacterium]
SEQEPIEEPATEAEPEPETIEEPVVEAASIETFAVVSDQEQTISSGPALMEWLEAHKNTGGTVKLADHVVLDGEYSFCPGGINRPSVYVDTDKYTITVTGEIELLSDNHLIFSGQPDGKSVFYVAEKGILSMQGVIVESKSHALWQEEGAGLVVSECQISGSVHYADTPFVIYQKSICVTVESGQTLNDALPTQIRCTVNRQGEISNNEWVPLSWNLEGTERQQEERQRFELQGSFLHAASAKPVQCTAVYNDCPLTFTDVQASIIGGRYTFQGGYTKPEEALPITVMSEYSFDGESWFTYEEKRVTDINIGFFIAFKLEQHDRAAHSNIYIRLQWNDNGTRYFSNVLCYAADNLESVEDIGGSRGGGTSIINLPDEPQKNTGSVPAADETPDTDSDNGKAEVLSGTSQTKNDDGDHGSDAANDGQSSFAETADANTEQPSYAEMPVADTEQLSNAEPFGSDAGQPIYTEASDSDIDQSLYAKTSDTGKDHSLYAQVPETNAESVLALASPQLNGQTLHADDHQGSYIVIVLGLVLLSVIAGIACFYVHSRAGTNR